MTRYSVAIDHGDSLLHCRIMGFLTGAEVADMVAEIRAAVRTLRGPSGILLALFDNRAGIVLGGETVGALTGALATDRHPNDRTAILVASSLATMQARRTMSESSNVFTDEGEARAWLIDQRRALLGEARGAP